MKEAQSAGEMRVGLFDLSARRFDTLSPARNLAPDKFGSGFNRKSGQVSVPLEILKRSWIVGNGVNGLVQRGNDIGRSSLWNPKSDPRRAVDYRISKFSETRTVWKGRVALRGSDRQAGQAALRELAYDARRSRRSKAVDLTPNCRMHRGLATPEGHMNNVDPCIHLEEREPGQVRTRPDPSAAESQIGRLRSFDELLQRLRLAAIDESVSGARTATTTGIRSSRSE